MDKHKIEPRVGQSKSATIAMLTSLKQAQNVQCLSGGTVSEVDVLLIDHHLLLSKHDTSPDTIVPKQRRPQEWYYAYPMISYCTYRPTPPGSGFRSSIRLRMRDFRYFSLNFKDERQAREIFEGLRLRTCKIGRIDKLMAFGYNPPSQQEKDINGWEIYDPKAEWKRQGISDKGIDRGWRISTINKDYVFSPTYPALLVVPSSISDSTIRYAGRYRSRVRIPALTYLHPVNNCSITRSSQPIVGLRGNRSIQDEKLVSACFSATATVGEIDLNSSTSSRTSPSSSQVDLYASNNEELLEIETENLEDDLIASSNMEVISEKPQIYGAQQNNLIVDARPTVNALAMQAVGLGSENMDHYKCATKAYLGIDNIHVMRESLAKVVEALKDSDISKLPPNKELLTKSNWLKHITGLLDGSALIARQVGIQHSHVLIHCSDGWDRTSQLSALSQIMLDPYYRTMEGFIILVEKDWLAFGHMFQLRCGFLNSERWFKIQNDAMAGTAIQPGGTGDGRGDALENALLSAKRFFNKGSHSQEAADSDGEGSFDGSSKVKSIPKVDVPKVDAAGKKEATDLDNLSPVFHQFLDATYQLLHQFPNRFEFNEYFLRRLFYHLNSCQYGTFLYNNEKTRLDERAHEKTHSVWSYFLSRRDAFTNPEYDGGEIDDHVKGKERLVFPKLDKVRWWSDLFGRKDEEMNGLPPIERPLARYNTPLLKESNPGIGKGFLTGVETAHQVLTIGQRVESTPTKAVSNGDSGRFAGLREGIAGLGLGGGSTSGGKSPMRRKEMKEIEVEMQ